MTVYTLTDRYVDAAMRTVPEGQRADLARELRASIDDQIEAQMDAGLERDDAERAVLTELGDPDKLAADYTDRPLYLIGPKYFLTWWRLLKLLLWIVPLCVVFAVALGQTIAGAPAGTIIGSVWGITLTVIAHLCFWTTLVFVIIERSEARTGQQTDIGEWTLDNLPEPRDQKALSELIGSLVWIALGVGALFWDRFLGWVPGYDVDVLAPGLWPWWVAGLLVVLAIEAVMHIVVYRVGRWTWAMATLNAVLALVVAVPALWLLSEGRLINPELWTLLPADAQDVPDILMIITGFGIAGVALWDIIEAYQKAYRSLAAGAL